MEEYDDDIEGDKRKTILIFGITSFVGSNLAEFFKKHYKVVGTYNKCQVNIPGVLTVPCDVLVKEEVQLVIYAFKPDVTIYAVGMSSIYDCHKYQELADALNTSGLFNVTEYSARYKAKVIYISSCFVFAGEDKNYLEMDIPDSINIYGKTQAAAEFYIQKTSLNYAIFRCCRLYGRSLNFMNPSWFDNLQRKFKKNSSFDCDDYVRNGFLDIYYLALIMKMCIDNEVTNRLFQVSTSDSCTLYEFTKKYAQVFQESGDLVSKSKWKFPKSMTHSTTDMIGDDLYFKMDVGNLGGFLNIKMPTVEESLEFTFKRLHGQRSAIRGSNTGDSVTFI
jgi:dTDP-4-dehydrorhamnose reductase